MFHNPISDILLLYLVVGFIVSCYTVIHEEYLDVTPGIWGNIEVAAYLIAYIIILIFVLSIPILNIIVAIGLGFWPYTLLRYQRKLSKLPDEEDLLQKFQSEGINGIIGAEGGKRRKYNAIICIDTFQNNNQELFENLLLDLVKKRDSKYHDYVNAIIRKIHSEEVLKSSFIEDRSTNVEGKSNIRKSIIERYRELYGIEADRLILNQMKNGSEPPHILEYVESEQVIYEIIEWAQEMDAKDDEEFGYVGLIDLFLSKKLKKLQSRK